MDSIQIIDQKIYNAKLHLQKLEDSKKAMLTLEWVEPTYNIESLMMSDKEVIGFHTLQALPWILESLYDDETFIVKHWSFKEIATIRMNWQHNRIIIREYITNQDNVRWLTEDNWMKFATQYPTQWFIQN